MCPSEAAGGLCDGLVCKRELSERTWNLWEKKIPTKGSFYSISYLFHVVTTRLVGSLVAVTAVLVKFGDSGTVRCVLCCSREKGTAHGPENTKNQVSILQVTPEIWREIVVPLKV